VSLLSFDLETHLIQPGLLAPPIVCGSFAARDQLRGVDVLIGRLVGGALEVGDAVPIDHDAAERFVAVWERVIGRLTRS